MPGNARPKAVPYEHFARIDRALANPARLELLDLLAQGERCVEELAEVSGMRLANPSAQLKTLAAASLLTSRRSGTRVFYQLAARLAELPSGTDIVAYCRERYCVMPVTAGATA